jgi:UDP-N-acetylglucosamine/UDP-N-acetylgalactosamine diphosphorylase
LCPSEHHYLLSHWDDLDESRRRGLYEQISQVDFEGLRREFGSLPGSEGGTGTEEGLAQSVCGTSQSADLAEPPEAVRLSERTPQLLAEANLEGSRAISAGEVAMVLVAGGQGTRLGFDQPKGMYSIGPVSGRTLFQMHVDSLRGAMKKFGVSIPLLIMTGPSTDGPTREYFAKRGNLGLSDQELMIFQQGTMPAVATEGLSELWQKLVGLSVPSNVASSICFMRRSTIH